MNRSHGLYSIILWDGMRQRIQHLFGLAKSGDYTLKVNFEQQKYDGNSWQPTNTTDTRQVSFSVTKANVTAPGADLTPAISRTGAVKTGDNADSSVYMYSDYCSRSNRRSCILQKEKIKQINKKVFVLFI